MTYTRSMIVEVPLPEGDADPDGVYGICICVETNSEIAVRLAESTPGIGKIQDFPAEIDGVIVHRLFIAPAEGFTVEALLGSMGSLGKTDRFRAPVERPRGPQL